MPLMTTMLGLTGRAAMKIVGLSLCCAAAAGGLLYVQYHLDGRQRTIDEQRQRIAVLEEMGERLRQTRRVGRLLVTEQSTGGDGVLGTTLIFIDEAADGRELPARRFRVYGETVHIETQLIRFEHGFVEEGDPLRGRSIALFTRIYGSKTAPDDGLPIDPPGQVPPAYRGVDPRVDAFESELWENFWRLTHDRSYAEARGVRVAQGETVWGMFRPGYLYTLELEAAGGLNLTSRPIDPIYRAALGALAGRD